MKHQYFINKERHFKSLKTYILIGTVCLSILVLINYFTVKFMGVVSVSLMLGGVVLISLISIYRTVFLLKLPLLTIDEKRIKYFNVLWYNSHEWDKFELAHFNSETSTISIGLRSGRIFDSFMLDSLSQQDIENVKKQFIENNKLSLQ